jgi:hypothetical protein
LRDRGPGSDPFRHCWFDIKTNATAKNERKLPGAARRALLKGMPLDHLLDRPWLPRLARKPVLDNFKWSLGLTFKPVDLDQGLLQLPASRLA